MTQARTPLPRVASHRLSAPTADDARDALRDLTDEDIDVLWADVTAEAGISAGALLLGVKEMQSIARVLQARPGAIGLAGRALAIRVGTYHELADNEEGALPADWARRTMELLLRGRVPDIERLDDIMDIDPFSPAAREALDRAATRAATRFGTAVGLVSVVLEGSQEFVGSHGLTGWLETVRGTPVEWSFCATTVRTKAPYVVEDTSKDVIQRTNPLVEKEGVGSYAGAPLITSTGQVIGSYCVLDGAARSYSEDDVAELQSMADALMVQLERSRISRRE